MSRPDHTPPSPPSPPSTPADAPAPAPGAPPPRYVSRGGAKLRCALDHFAIDPAGLRCADLGCSTGGFTDCLLQAGAAHVTAIDTGYGVLAWALRSNPRVRTIERANALHTPPAGEHELVDLVVMDLGWTPQRLAVPAALAWLKPAGRLVTLIKPHYEDKPLAKSHRGILPDDLAQQIAQRTADELARLDLRVHGLVVSPVRGSGGKAAGDGNQEWLALITRT